MSVKDILDYPQNKLHYIVNMECSVPCYRTANFGQIVFWIRLSCDVNRVRMFKQQRKKLETSTNSEMRRAENESKPRSRRFSQQEFKSPESSLDTLHTIHDSRRRDTHFESITKSHQYQSSTTSTSERIDPNVGYEESRSDNFQSRTDSWRAWSSGDYSGRRKEIGEAVQLQQQINSGFPDTDNLFDDTNTVITDDWGRYKRKSLNSQMTETGDAVVIRIERLSLFPRCTLLNDRDVKQLYVEFSFLGNHGPDLETVSVPIPRSSPYHLYFNYMKKFDIDTKIHSDQRKKLEEMLSDEVSSTVKFTIVNEPLMEEMETKDCVEVGHAYLNLKEHVLNGGSHDISLKVSNIEASDTIGSLKITVLGADAIRKCITQD
ncbi:uncharacterized protein [Fopius arisanus]|uniref:RPGRIP1 C-terminal domain-containing protein n=1 Tax=Fopius arisanus TaxID=64838 RepID=A0A9R1T5D4_9HYME|nr:PREDICTED: uncharacterized protein LOC105266364 [Fopius arisanus]